MVAMDAAGPMAVAALVAALADSAVAWAAALAAAVPAVDGKAVFSRQFSVFSILVSSDIFG